jgi:hypothetical protein
MKPSGKKHTLRLSAVDYIASLVRSEAYAKDYEAYTRAFEEEQNNRKRGIILRVSGDATQDFLKRWPLVWEPIDTVKAKRSPLAYIENLMPPVVMAKDVPDWWCDNVDNLPWPEGRFHPVWINFFRTEEEITDGINHLLNQLRLGGIRMPVPRRRGGPGRWEVWDTYHERGRENIRKTAEILFPKSFDYGGDNAEMKKEAKDELDRKGGRRHASPSAINEYDNRIATAGAARWRTDERRQIFSYVRQVIKACGRMVEMHRPAVKKLNIMRLI